jgi:hypothetical protein
VHQWQAETGLAVDHGRGFRRKAREVGVEPQARRQLARKADGTPAADVSRATPPASPPGYFPGSREEA